jgi:TonB family protein
MSEPAENTHQPPLAGQLSEAQGLVEAGNFKDALALLKHVKTLDPRNIYVLAFEKQVEQLVEFSDMNILTDEQRTDILESIPGIIQRALEASSGDAAEELAEKQQAIDREREERAAALEWLKNQYFQHAHEYVRKGEYTHALAEIRRVYIIDPSNRIAEDFEHQIEQLIALRKVQTMPRPPARPAFAPSAGSTSERPAVVLPARPQVRQEQAPRPEPASRPATPPQPREPDPEPPRKRHGFAIVIGIVVSLLVVLLAAYYFFGRRPSAPPAVPEAPQNSEAIPATEDSYAPMESSREQGFLVSLSENNGSISARVSQERTDAGTGSFDDSGSEPDSPSREIRSAPASEQKNRGKSSRVRPSSSTDRSSPAERGVPGSAASQPSSAVASNAVGSVTEEARIVRLERPQFAGGTNAEGLEGQVVVRVEIDREGVPRQTTILRSTNSLLDAPVIAAINKSSFSPRRTSAGAVNSWMTIPFTFRSTKQ